jgi:CheY-like chemotaxis protein
MRVLVVDDEPDVVGFVRLVLEGAGYEVDTAGDGQQALSKLEAQRFDLMVLDIMMPVMNGWAVLKHLKAQGAPPPVVVILSAVADVHQALNEGASACLPKPFQLRDLLNACAKALARPT